jgi:hypothetical protein
VHGFVLVADKVDRFMRYYEAMNSDEVSAWIQRNVTPAMVGKSNWRRIVYYGLEAALRQRVEKGLAIGGIAGAREAIDETVTEARRLWIADRRRAQYRAKAKLAEDIAIFVRQYGRKKRARGYDQNDRHYDRKVEKLVKRMDPVELDTLLRGDAEGPTSSGEEH